MDRAASSWELVVRLSVRELWMSLKTQYLNQSLTIFFEILMLSTKYLRSWLNDSVHHHRILLGQWTCLVISLSATNA